LEGKAACAAEELVVGTASCVLAVRLGVGPQFDQSAAYFGGRWKRYDRING
jgi:antirestriction protein ArdC